MSKLAVIFGGSGFVGRYIARRMAKEGWRVRIAVRRPDEALFVKPYGVVGQVEPVLANVRDDMSVMSVVHDVDAVVNCVGLLTENRRNTFDAVQYRGAERIARIAAEADVARLVQLSAIGADANSDSAYARSKALGEAGVLRHFPDAVILRPSIIFGPEDVFFNRFADMARMSPVLPIVGAGTKFQPVYVDDVAQAAVMGVLGQARPGIYELGGPDMETFRALMQRMLNVIQRRRLIVSVPFWTADIMGGLFDLMSTISRGLFVPPLTRDQVRNLRHDNVTAQGRDGFSKLGIAPTSLEAVLPEYLWRFRPSGQYAAIKASANNLKI